MSHKFYLKTALKNLGERSIRSWLTVSGVIISIAVILMLLTLTAGLQGAITELFEEFGSNTINILPAGGLSAAGGAELFESDVDTVSSLRYYESVHPFMTRNGVQIDYRGDPKFTRVNSFPSSQSDQIDRQYKFSEEMSAGRYFNQNERKVAIVGYNVANDEENWFSRPISLRNNIIIAGESFRVVGIMKEYGTPDDNEIIIPMEDFKELFDVGTKIDGMVAFLRPNMDAEEARDATERLLERRKGKDSVIVLSPQGILRQFNQITGVVTSLLLAIASISMVVGALGIVNTMFTSILEREAEIGIIKSVGGKNSNVLGIFMYESAMIGLVGGIVGIALGIAGSYVIGFIAELSGFKLLNISINIMHVLISLFFAVAVGLFSGFFPSYIASKKKIVDTLRSF
jgi:putative ABC transport system permease protein